MGYSKVYDSIQPVTEPDNIFRSDVEISTNKSLKFEGEKSFYESDKLTVTNEKLANYRMVIGTDRSLYGLLKKNKDIFPNGPYHMDSRDDGIKIHNHNFNQPPKYVYTYLGGNGELLSCNISTQKKSKSVQAQQHSTIDPLTKEVKTSVIQSCNNEEPLSKEDEFQTSLFAKLTGTEKSKEEERNEIIRSAKDEKATKEELQSNYQVTKDDIEKYVGEIKGQFKDLYDNAKNTGDIMPLLKSNSLKKGVIKVKKKVRTLVNPQDYSNSDPNSYNSYHANFNDKKQAYNMGLKYLKNSSNIIFLGYEGVAGSTEPVDYKTATDRQILPRAWVIMDKEIELELDGARILSSPLTQDLQDSISLNNTSDNVQKVTKMDLRVIGRPGLTSSLILMIRNISDRYSGEWYTKKVTHRINTSGYICSSELIKKSPVVVVSNTTSKIDTKDIYSTLHKVANKRMKSIVPTKESLNQAFHEFIKSNPEFKDKSLVLDLSKSQDGTFEIHPASDDQVNINKEREKHRL